MSDTYAPLKIFPATDGGFVVMAYDANNDVEFTAFAGELEPCLDYMREKLSPAVGDQPEPGTTDRPDYSEKPNPTKTGDAQ